MSKRNRSTPKGAPTPPTPPAKMEERRTVPQPKHAPPSSRTLAPSRPAHLALAGLLFFILVCLSSAASVKWAAACLLAAVIALALTRGKDLITRLSWPFFALSLLVLMCGISTAYALSGKFALGEFLKLTFGYCVFLLFLLFPGKGERRGHTAATLVEIAAALSALLSIDLLSTRVIFRGFEGLMGLVGNKDYSSLAALEPGVRMTGIFSNPNVLAGCLGLGVLLSLGLVRSAGGRGERRLHLSCLSVSALGFILAFSMGASAAIIPAFLLYLLLEDKEQRTPQLILMLQVLVLSLVCSFPIFFTSFQTWNGFQPIPLLCALGGAALLCLSDQMAGARISAFFAARDRAFYGLIAGVLALCALFMVLALNLTGAGQLEGGQTLRRAAYPNGGTFALAVESSAPVQVTIESQNEPETMMHTSTVLYQGAADGARFSVPEDSLVVYFNFQATQPLTLTSATLNGGGETLDLKLGYKLLPGFIANRLQGLFANENAIQRTVFFRDGLTLFQRSPLIGLGMGSFENAILGVQSFFYETKFAHNHYIQLLLETGVVGLGLFLAVLGTSIAAVLLARRKEAHSSLTAALGATLAFMAIHAATEVVFSASQYLPLALGCIALVSVCCGDALPLPQTLDGKKLRLGLVRGLCAAMSVFLLLLCGNLYGNSISYRSDGRFFRNMQSALFYDKFEWADYMLSYVHSALSQSDLAVVEQANVYARRLEQVPSNTIPLYLGEFYLRQDRPTDALRVLEQYVNYTASDSRAWNSAFSLLFQYESQVSDRETLLAGVEHLYGLLQTWDAAHIGSLTLAAEVEAQVAQVVQRSR